MIHYTYLPCYTHIFKIHYTYLLCYTHIFMIHYTKYYLVFRNIFAKYNYLRNREQEYTFIIFQKNDTNGKSCIFACNTKALLFTYQFKIYSCKSVLNCNHVERKSATLVKKMYDIFNTIIHKQNNLLASF